ncbi:MAG: TOMM precursor leader peptide-binding protein [Acidobacteriota bacterium]|nr:TOMM precursor leader peptide-binding protein [Acidobacteriota bacterium]
MPKARTSSAPQAPEPPRLHPHYRVRAVDGEGAIFVSETRHHWFPGSFYARLVPLLDGRNTIPQLIHRLREHDGPAEIFAALVLLRELGLLAADEDASDLPREPPRPPWSQSASATDQTRPVGLSLDCFAPSAERRGDHEVAADVRELLPDASLEEVSDGEAELWLIPTTSYDHPGLEEMRRALWSAGRLGLLLRPHPEVSWLGPLLGPEDALCLACLNAAIAANRPVQRWLGEGASGTAAFGGWKQGLKALVQGLAAVDLGPHSPLRRRLWSFDLASRQVRPHPVPAGGGCPQCGGPEREDGRETVLSAAPVHLVPRPKASTDDGGHRALPVEETYRRLERCYSPITGIVHGLRRLPAETPAQAASSQGLHVYSAAHAIPRSYDSWGALRRRLGRHSSGKGKNAQQARVSALAEAVERYSGIFRGDEPRRSASFQELGKAAVHPNRCMLFSQAQIQGREDWNRREGLANWVPAAFPEDRLVEWSPLWSLTEETTRWLPTGLLYYDYEEQAPLCLADSNGNAAGNTVEEAVLQGFLELVERDAAALWWYSRVQRPAVDLESFADAHSGELLRHLESQGRRLWSLDLTSDFGVPVVAALSRRRDTVAGDLMMGFGAHLDPDVAVGRALTELVQFLPRRSGDNPLAQRWPRLAAGQDPQWLEPAPDQPSRAADDWPDTSRPDLAQDVAWLVERARDLDLDVLVLDQSRREAPLKVVKVVVPGMRPWWARFAPGRLYDVPVRLGWLPAARSEEELNPVHLFL